MAIMGRGELHNCQKMSMLGSRQDAEPATFSMRARRNISVRRQMRMINI
jgi:hypothetical protein